MTHRGQGGDFELDIPHSKPLAEPRLFGEFAHDVLIDGNDDVRPEPAHIELGPRSEPSKRLQ
jgi:hypothetical protein